MFKIGNVEIENPVVMAPMAGITNMAFRKIIKDFGAGLVYSEMVSDKALLKNPPDLAHARIYDRILERCAPILFAGKNFREENAEATKAAAKGIDPVRSVWQKEERRSHKIISILS